MPPTLAPPEAAPRRRFRPRATGRLFWRLLLWFCLANIVTLLVSVAVTRHIVRELHHQPPPDWITLAQRAGALYVPDSQHAARALRPLRERLHDQRIAIGLLDAKGTVLVWPPHWVLRYREQLRSSAKIVLHPHRGVTLIGMTTQAANGAALRFIGVHFHPHGGRFHWWPLAVEILVSLFVIGAVGWWVARSIGQPVGAVQNAARRFARGELDARVGAPVSGSASELSQMGRDFDDMAARIQSLLERQRGVLQDVSHELRSPLTRLGLALELARSEAGTVAEPALDRAEREIARLDRIIGEVLELSRMEVQLPGMARQRLDFNALVAERAEQSRAPADSGGGSTGSRIELHLSQPAATALANPALLARAIDNLLSNALKFSPPGTTVSVTTDTDDGKAWVDVADRGPGVPEDELGALFRPFYRGSNGARADGSGLGLAIVARIAHAHRGAASAHNCEGGGLCARLEIPLATTTDGDAKT